MKTHNANIYHCTACGNVVHTELEAEPPQCCGHSMTKACEETIGEGDVTSATEGGHPEAASPTIKVDKKPR